MCALLINIGLNSRNNISWILNCTKYLLDLHQEKKKEFQFISPSRKYVCALHCENLSYAASLFCGLGQIHISKAVKKAIFWIAFFFLYVVRWCAVWLAQKSLACIGQGFGIFFRYIYWRKERIESSRYSGVTSFEHFSRFLMRLIMMFVFTGDDP